MLAAAVGYSLLSGARRYHMQRSNLHPVFIYENKSPEENLLFLSCIDLRLTDNLLNFLHFDHLANRYDDYTLAGASLMTRFRDRSFTSCFKQKFYDRRTTGHQSLPHWERCLGCHLQISKHLHHIQDVYIVEHQSCGACKEYLNEDRLAADEVACIANSRKPSGLRKFLF
jgi:carbonic anhydrase